MSLPVYPDLPYDASSKITGIRDGRSTVTTTDGTVTTTLAHENEKYNFRLVHSWMNAARQQQIEAFYEANRYTPFEWALNGKARVWKYAKKPMSAEQATGYRTYTVDLVEV